VTRQPLRGDGAVFAAILSPVPPLTTSRGIADQPCRLNHQLSSDNKNVVLLFYIRFVFPSLLHVVAPQIFFTLFFGNTRWQYFSSLRHSVGCEIIPEWLMDQRPGGVNSEPQTGERQRSLIACYPSVATQLRGWHELQWIPSVLLNFGHVCM